MCALRNVSPFQYGKRLVAVYKVAHPLMWNVIYTFSWPIPFFIYMAMEGWGKSNDGIELKCMYC